MIPEAQSIPRHTVTAVAIARAMAPMNLMFSSILIPFDFGVCAVCLFWGVILQKCNYFANFFFGACRLVFSCEKFRAVFLVLAGHFWGVILARDGGHFFGVTGHFFGPWF